MYQIWTQFSYYSRLLLTKHISKNKRLVESKGVKWGEIAKGDHFSKITETASLPAMELVTDKSLYNYGGYITRR